MKLRTAFLIGLLTAAALSTAPVRTFASESADSPLVWRAWTADLFETAQKEGKLVLLDMEAVWCHWCHVMDQTTYRDPKVVEILQKHFITVRVDQDADPALSLRYEEWGWPATILFAADGTELAKRRGYIDPPRMASLLDAIVKDPTPGPSVAPDLDVKPAANPLLDDAQKASLEKDHAELYDLEFGGWGERHKLIDSNHLEWAIARAKKGDAEEEKRARKTLDEALHLLDAEWGGFYQYSDERDWKSPHYEKIMSIQASYMRLYALASLLWNEPRYLEAAKRTSFFVSEFWTSPEGDFYTSQDADVSEAVHGKDFYSRPAAERAKMKAPRIDTNVYARENGWMIAALAQLSDASGEPEPLARAVNSARRMIETRSIEGGGFRHAALDKSGPYLGDTLAMGQAFLALYGSTADREWLARSEDAAQFIEKNFRGPEAGYVAAPTPAGATGALKRPVRQIEENVSIARWTALLSHYTGNKAYREMGEHAMRYLASPAIIGNRRFLAGVLVADAELSADPAHLTIVGSKNDPDARELFMAARRAPEAYRRIEWWDPAEGALPNPDVQYPELEKAAAFVCADGSCSVPYKTSERLSAAVDKLRAKAYAIPHNNKGGKA